MKARERRINLLSLIRTCKLLHAKLGVRMGLTSTRPRHSDKHECQPPARHLLLPALQTETPHISAVQLQPLNQLPLISRRFSRVVAADPLRTLPLRESVLNCLERKLHLLYQSLNIPKT